MISSKYILWVGIILTVVIGLVSWYTGPDISLKLYNLLLIGAVTWYVGRNEGIIVALVAITMWILNLVAWDEFSLLLDIWGTLERAVLFAATVLVLEYIHSRYEVKLQRAEERYSKIVESAIEGIVAVNEQNTVLFTNARASELLGYPSEKLQGINLLVLARDEPSRLLLHRMATDVEHTYCPCEVQLSRMDGSSLWSLISATSPHLHVKNTKETVLLLTDITERKKTEEELQRRYEQISAMQRLSFGLAQSLHLDQRLLNALRVVLEVTKFDAGLIYLVDETQGDLVVQFSYGLSYEFIERVRRWAVGKGNTGKAVESGKAIFIQDAEYDAIFDQGLRSIENIHGFATIPLFSKDRVLGVLSIVHRTPYVFSEELQLMLQAFGKQIGFAIENARLYEAARVRERELREMSLAMVRLQEEERKRFAREIHDGLSQVLTVLKINTELTTTNFDTDREKAAAYLQEVRILANEAENEAKRLANDLRPAILDDFGLKAAIKLHATNFERRTGISVDLHLPFYEIRFDPMIETSMYRIVQ
ncbi:MAG: PAS domain S-box protein, partial [Bacteroidetes bacterium]